MQESRLKAGEGLLNRTSNTNHSNPNVFTRAARAFAWIGRVLLMLTAILLVTTPLTQYIWTWDHFLHGGQDYELSTLMVLAFLSLVLVLAQHRKQSLDLLFAARRQSSFLSRASLAPIALAGVLWTLSSECGASPGLEQFGLPLQI